MPTPPVLDLNVMLAPIAGPSPSGSNLRDLAANPTGRNLYDAIRGARSQARLKEKPQALGDPTAPPGPPDEWRTVLDKAIEATALRSKDLEVVTYLIEAITRLEGFAGLRDAFALYHGLVAQHWDSLFPPPGEDGMAGRVAGLGGLNGDATRDGALLFPISRVPLTDGNGAGYGMFHYQVAEAMDKLPPERQEERVKAGQVSLKLFEDSAKKTPVSFRVNLAEDLTQCLAEFDKLETELTAKCGQDAPPSSRIREALRKCLFIVQNVGGPLVAATAGAKTGNAGKTTAANAGGVMTEIPATFRNRDEAFEVVLRVANFFRETEPHSPVIFALEQSVRWGRMKLPDLLTELIADDSARNRMFQLVGIRPPENKG